LHGEDADADGDEDEDTETVCGVASGSGLLLRLKTVYCLDQQINLAILTHWPS